MLTANSSINKEKRRKSKSLPQAPLPRKNTSRKAFWGKRDSSSWMREKFASIVMASWPITTSTNLASLTAISTWNTTWFSQLDSSTLVVANSLLRQTIESPIEARLKYLPRGPCLMLTTKSVFIWETKSQTPSSSGLASSRTATLLKTHQLKVGSEPSGSLPRRCMWFNCIESRIKYDHQFVRNVLKHANIWSRKLYINDELY